MRIELMKVNLTQTKRLIRKYHGKKGILIPLLQDIQSAYGYIPTAAIEIIAQELSIFPVDIYGILTFYAQFYLTPRGKHTIKVCQGTACHVMGGKDILDYLSGKLGINQGETSQDRMFSLERVACLGCCGMAPVVVIDNAFYGRATVEKVKKLLLGYRLKKNK
ncbi:MAG: NADH-quinone oxidoreductase subunit NuoE [Candidatus Omnitrophica bacterium]|nr:NADH-quinone oxidoreductase subunit NuoE [Candidatus Omnitrophota bacterium]